GPRRSEEATMSWSNPEIVAKVAAVQAEAPAKPVDPAFAAMLEKVERQAVSNDPCGKMQGRLIQACQPILQEWGERGVIRRDVRFGAEGAVGIVRAFAIMLANVMAAVPPSVGPRLKEDFDKQLAQNVTLLREHLD